MIRKGPTKNERSGVDRMGRTELHYAALEADLLKVKQLLLADADPNASDDNGLTPLHFAAQSNSYAVSEALILAGASVDSFDANGNTPLSDAVFHSDGSGDLIKLLLRSGADRNKENNYGISPLELAQSIGNFDLAQFFQ
ncbi:ankyrin repeat protein [Acidovorax sp. 100]|uniref:ankyrin repeat domain-containing protein n=1 Tax=Acidovorax sp. 100 TaxID=2135635 RepID=UPI000EF9C89F|nr:ankyrin repeat domain-containing protein [Acidovorax sp. 100]RMA63037.1 ankyrin repeat protein [Acidovorax sp. 100]